MTNKEPKPERFIKHKILNLGELWNRVTHGYKIREMQDILRLCEQHSIKKPKCVLMSLAICLSGRFDCAPNLTEKLAKVKP